MTSLSKSVPRPTNEPVLTYAPSSEERRALEFELEAQARTRIAIPLRIGRQTIHTRDTKPVAMPHAHSHVLADLSQAEATHVRDAIEVARGMETSWREMPLSERAGIFLRAAEMLSGPWRARISAACMLGQSKTVHQSEIDAVCELADFFRFNAYFAEQIAQRQPESAKGVWNSMDYRPLEGFVLAITPFNFLAIGGNLPTAPALMGNVVLWKPADSAAYGAYHVLELLREAGLPDGVISFLPGDGPTVASAALESEHLAGVHFTGSTSTFTALWKGVATNLDRYRTFPRLVGETGGKDFVVVHPSANLETAVTAVIRGGYEYQGQKCSAASRIYVPRSSWPHFEQGVADQLSSISMGDVRDFRHFMSAVIDKKAFDRITDYVALAKSTANVIVGHAPDDSVGYFVPPTFVRVDDPNHRLMREEIFGPVVSAYVYEDSEFTDLLELVDRTSPYGLTGAIFASDRAAIESASTALRNAAGNFYINDKPTGAVVGQQPFGGARRSGTNDKAGSELNLLRWTSPRTIKETFVAPTDYRYPYMKS